MLLLVKKNLKLLWKPVVFGNGSNSRRRLAIINRTQTYITANTGKDKKTESTIADNHFPLLQRKTLFHSKHLFISCSKPYLKKKKKKVTKHK